MGEHAPAQKSLNNQTLSLGNQDSITEINAQALNECVPPVKSVEQIRTYIIWSIFNLLFLPFGLLCCYFSYRISQFKIQSRYEPAKKWSRRGFVVNIMTTLLMIGTIITIVMLNYDHVQRSPDPILNRTRTTGAFIPWQPGRK